MLDEKDILVCVHTRNILRARGCYRYVKVPSSPYKRGRKGTCKRIQTFWNLCYLQRESQSLCALTLSLNVLRTLSRVWVVIRIFQVTPQHSTRGRLRTTRQGRQNYSNLSCSTTKYSGACRMGLPGPTASVGTRTDYSVGPWDYSTWVTRHLMAWGTRSTMEGYSDRKLCMSYIM
jgi:hypothetical protein